LVTELSLQEMFQHTTFDPQGQNLESV